MPDKTLTQRKRTEAAVCFSSLPRGRPLVEAGSFPETVMDCTIQVDKKERKKGF